MEMGNSVITRSEIVSRSKHFPGHLTITSFTLFGQGTASKTDKENSNDGTGEDEDGEFGGPHRGTVKLKA